MKFEFKEQKRNDDNSLRHMQVFTSRRPCLLYPSKPEIECLRERHIMTIVCSIIYNIAELTIDKTGYYMFEGFRSKYQRNIQEGDTIIITHDPIYFFRLSFNDNVYKYTSMLKWELKQ